MSLKFLDLQQGSQAWTAFRRSRIGASDIAAIMGKDPWKTPLMVYEEKVLGTSQEVNADMQRGHDLEPYVRNMINEQYFRNYKPIVVANDKYDFGFASLDGWDGQAEPVILEIKCPRRHNPALPDHHYLQMQWQMMITEKDEVLYVSYDGQEIIEKSVKRDEECIKEIKQHGYDFFGCLTEFDPPEPTDKDLVEILDSEAQEKAERRAFIKVQMGYLKKEAEDLDEYFKKVSDGRSCKIGQHRFVKFTRKGSVDYSLVPELQNVNLEQYRKQKVEAWLFT